MLFFHFVTEGCCKVRLADSTEVLDVAAGDLVCVPTTTSTSWAATYSSRQWSGHPDQTRMQRPTPT